MKMEPQPWEHVKEVLYAAIERPNHERAQFLDGECGGDLVLRQEVESLIASYERDGGLLDRPRDEAIAELLVTGRRGNLIGQKFGSYHVISLLGAGGMGEVYLAQDTKLDRQVALKVLLDEVAGDDDRVRRFVQEAKAASALNHPNILTVYEIGEFEDSRYIATELIKGETLRDRSRGEAMTLREVLDVAMQVAAALNAAHGAGIVHRDIKPENIMLRDDGIVKVLDFGLAKLVAQTGSADSQAATRVQINTWPGVVMGTVLYMSPEQARGRESDSRCDVWSLGVVIYEMLAGATPFAGETANDSIAAILTKEPPPLDDATPPELRRIVRKSLQKQTDERYQTVKDLLLDVKNLKRELEFSEELERSHMPYSTGSSNVSTGQMSENVTAVLSGVISTQTSVAPQQRSSAEYLVSQVEQHKYWTALILTFAVLLVAGAGFGYYKYAGSKNANISSESAKFTRLTNSGKVVTTAISPDGKWLVYATSDGEQQTLWLQQSAVAGNGTQILPPAPVRYAGLAFSPDGIYLFYTVFEVDDSSGTLYQVPVLGGNAQKLFSNLWGKVSFSPDGKQITYYSREDDLERLMIANADGSGQRQLMERHGNEFIAQFYQGPAWSPDGKTIAITAGTYSPRNVSVASVLVATGEVKFFSPKKFYDAADLLWLADGRSLLVLANEQLGFLKVWQISYPSGDAQPISTDLNNYSAISLTDDSKGLATVQGTAVSNIWTGNSTDTVLSAQLTSGSDQNFQPSWAPDGRIVYSKYCCSYFRDLYIGDPRGGSPKQLTTNSGSNEAPVLSPDGRFIVFTSNRTGTWGVWRIDIDGGNPIQLTFNNDANPSFSPDGREVVFLHYANKGNIWKVGIDGGTPVQLTDKESNSPRFSPDGKQLVCHYREDPKAPYKLAIISSAGGAPIKTFALPKGYVSAGLRWSPDGRSILYAENKTGVTNIWAQPIDGTASRQITNFTSGSIGSFDFSRDGKQIAVSRGTSTNDVVLISGFKK